MAFQHNGLLMKRCRNLYRRPFCSSYFARRSATLDLRVESPFNHPSVLIMNKLIPIKGQVQAYQWGGFDYLPTLLQYNNSQQLPQAEYWLGAHPAAPAVAVNENVAVADVLVEQHHELRFLFKILDVREMLSIQVHPTKTQAQAGFERENQQGLGLTAKNRNYKDANHKPELMVALSEFWLLHGFRSETQIATALASQDYLQPLLQVLDEQGLQAAFELALSSQEPVVAKINQSLQKDFSQRPAIADKNCIDFWIARWLDRNPDELNGLLTLFFLNLVKVNPGEALYQPSGLLHAYLEGQNVELMANSDNVLRAGLTPKHIDVAELLKVCTIKPSNPQDYVIQAQILENQEKRFPTPFDEFELSEMHSERAETLAWSAQKVEILMCLEGEAKITSGTEEVTLARGEALLILPEAEVRATLRSPATQLYKAKNL